MQKSIPVAASLAFPIVQPMRECAQRWVQRTRQWRQERRLGCDELYLQGSADHADCERRQAQLNRRPVSWVLTPWT